MTRKGKEKRQSIKGILVLRLKRTRMDHKEKGNPGIAASRCCRNTADQGISDMGQILVPFRASEGLSDQTRNKVVVIKRREAKKLVGHSATNLEYRMAPPGCSGSVHFPPVATIISTAAVIIICAGDECSTGREKNQLVRKERIGGLDNANHTRETQKREKEHTNANLTAHAHATHIRARQNRFRKKRSKQQSIKGESNPQETVKENALRRRGISQMYKNKGISEV